MVHVLLKRVLPACTGRAVDARALDELIRADDDLARRLEGFVNHFYTKFEGRIVGGDRALRVAGGQVGAMIALLHNALLMVETRLPPRAASLLFADAIGRGTAARALAEADRSAHPDVAFVMGTLANLGEMLQLVDDPANQLRWWQELRRVRGLHRRHLTEQVLGQNPAMEGARALAELGAPEVLMQVLTAEYLDDVDEGWQPVARLVHRADALVQALSANDSGVALDAWVKAIGEDPGLPATGAWALVQEVLDQTPAVARALELPCTPWPDLATLHNRRGGPPALDAQDLQILADLQAEVIRDQTLKLGRLEQALTDRLRVDPVTDLLTFQAFVARLGIALQDPSSGLSAVVAIDLPGFGKRFASYGLRTSDRLLARVARTLDNTFRESDLITRCGPATFLVAVPGSPRMARVLSERARAALTAIEIPGRDGAVRTPVAVGVLSLVDVPVGLKPEAVIEAARRAAFEGEVGNFKLFDGG